MIKEALEFLSKLQTPKNPVTVEVNGQHYAVEASGTLGQPVRDLAPQWQKPVFKVSTLSALKCLFEAKLDDFPETVGLHVADYRTVRLVSLKADEFGRRHVYAEAVHEAETPFKFNLYLPAEEFLIGLRASFYYNDEAVKVQQVCSQLSSGTAVNLADDGISQKLEVSGGTISKAQVVIPAEGIELILWRTFRDAPAVASKFLLRLKSVKDGLPTVALFEIDQKWRLDSIHAIGEWLGKNIQGVTIIA